METKKVAPKKESKKESSPKKEVRGLLSKKPETECINKSYQRLEMSSVVFGYQIMPKEKEVDIDIPQKKEVVI